MSGYPVTGNCSDDYKVKFTCRYLEGFHRQNCYRPPPNHTLLKKRLILFTEFKISTVTSKWNPVYYSKISIPGGSF